MLTRLTPVATLIDTKQQSANQGCSGNKKCVETHPKIAISKLEKGVGTPFQARRQGNCPPFWK